MRLGMRSQPAPLAIEIHPMIVVMIRNPWVDGLARMMETPTANETAPPIMPVVAGCLDRVRVMAASAHSPDHSTCEAPSTSSMMAMS